MLFRTTLQKELLQTSILVFAAIVGIFFAQRITYYIGVVANGTFPSDSIGTLLGFSLLRYLPTIISLSLFLSILFTLTRQSRDNEMIIWFSSGMSISRWVAPILTFSIPVIVVIAFLSFVVTPWVIGKGNEFKAQIKSKDELASITPGVFKESRNEDRVFFIESFDNLGKVVKNVFVQTQDHGKLSIIVSGRGYRETAANQDDFVVMEKGRRYEGDKKSAAFNSTSFDRYGVRIQQRHVEPEPLSIQALSNTDLISQRSHANIAELHNRIALPLSALILSLLAIPLSYVDQRSGRSTNFMMAILIFVIYNNMLSIMNAWLIQKKISLILGLWPIHLIFIALVAYLFYRRVNQRPFIPGMGA
jgi:lipopolysaccharide export system permease protein